jgi:hypothetical protein
LPKNSWKPCTVGSFSLRSARWKKSDSDAYEENGVRKLPAETIISAVEAVAREVESKSNPFRYFVQELVAIPDPRIRA